LVFVVVLTDLELGLQGGPRTPHRHRSPPRIVGPAGRRTAIDRAIADCGEGPRGMLEGQHRIPVATTASRMYLIPTAAVCQELEPSPAYDPKLRCPKPSRP